MDPQTLAKALTMLIITILVVIAITRIFKAAVFRIIIVLAILFFLAPTLCTILWGDGEAYVAMVASLFSPRIEQQINDGYAYYHSINDPVIDLDQINEYLDMAKDRITGMDNQDSLVFPMR